MSPSNCRAASPAGPSRREWQSMQEFFFCGCCWAAARAEKISVAADASARTRSRGRAARARGVCARAKCSRFRSVRRSSELSCLWFIVVISSGEIADDRHHRDVDDDEHAEEGEGELAPAVARRLVEERNEQPEQSARAEDEHADDLAVVAEDFRRDELERLEHEEEVPLRLDAGGRGRERVGLLAQLPREERGERGQSTDGENPADRVAHEEVGEEFHLPNLLAFVLEGHAHAVHLHEQDVEADERRGRRGQHGDVEAEEARQGRARHLVAAAQEAEHRVSDDWYHSCDLRADFGGEEGELVPGQEVAAEAEADADEEESDARHPGHLAWASVGAHEIDAEHGNEQSRDHEVGRPTVYGAYEPAELHVRHDELYALERVLGARSVVEQQEDARADLHREEEERHAAEVVPDGLAVERDFLVARDLGGGTQRQPLVEPEPEAFGFHGRHPFFVTTMSSP